MYFLRRSAFPPFLNHRGHRGARRNSDEGSTIPQPFAFLSAPPCPLVVESVRVTSVMRKSQCFRRCFQSTHGFRYYGKLRALRLSSILATWLIITTRFSDNSAV